MAETVSIIIPCYNAARWLAETLDSALAQTWKDTEIIVVDDGSKDDSLTIARSYESRGVHVVAQANQGASAARNAGLLVSKGDFIQFLDADDALSENKIELQILALHQAGEKTLASCAWGEFKTDFHDATFIPQAVWQSLTPVEWLACSWEGGGMMHPAAWLTPRKTALAAGEWNESLSLDDDGEYFSRVLLQSKKVEFVPDAKSYYRSHTGVRLSGSAGPKAAQSSYLACELKEKNLLATEDSSRTRHALACNYCRFAWEQLDAAPQLVEKAIARWQQLDSTVKAPRGGTLYNILAATLGWQTARRLQLRRQRA